MNHRLTPEMVIETESSEEDVSDKIWRNLESLVGNHDNPWQRYLFLLFCILHNGNITMFTPHFLKK